MKQRSVIPFPLLGETKARRLARLRFGAKAAINRVDSEEMLELITAFAGLNPVLAEKLLKLADKTAEKLDENAR